jgi:hypothetical protein
METTQAKEAVMSFRAWAMAAVAACALAGAALPGTATAQEGRPRVFTPDNAPVVHTYRHHRHARSTNGRGGGERIACTALGCHPIPRNCRVGHRL